MILKHFKRFFLSFQAGTQVSGQPTFLRNDPIQEDKKAVSKELLRNLMAQQQRKKERERPYKIRYMFVQ